MKISKKPGKIQGILQNFLGNKKNGFKALAVFLHYCVLTLMQLEYCQRLIQAASTTLIMIYVTILNCFFNKI